MARRQNDLACQELVELVTDDLQDALIRKDRARLDTHVDGYDGCREYLAQMRRTIEVTGRLRSDDCNPTARDRLLEVVRPCKVG